MTSEEIEAAVDAMAAAVGMPIAPECRPGVLHNWALMHGLAQTFVHVELAPDVEPANVFTP
jgi:hypothetical protein